ncbi:MAG: PP2C family protein-serine/threonine phosphatase, partial [Gammaproteobacteria bacterium]
MSFSTAGGTRVQIAVLSRIGGREKNEDACGYWNDGGPVCCVLSDGAGGHGGGDVASRIAVETILRAFAENPVRDARGVLDLMSLANREVMREQSRAELVRDMRATLVLLTFDPDTSEAWWGHVGDSRLYWFRSGFVSARTRDHSLVQSMMDAGFAPADDLRLNPERSVLIASLGGDDGFEPEVTATPQMLRAGDAFLLCSDGFWDYVDEQAM